MGPMRLCTRTGKPTVRQHFPKSRGPAGCHRGAPDYRAVWPVPQLRPELDRMSTDWLTQAQDLCLERQHKQVLDHVSLSVKSGQIVTLIGPNGCGKSTLLRVLLRLTKPDSGHVEHRDGLRIGYMPQRLSLEPRLPLTVDGFLTLARGARRQHIDEWLSRLEINAIRHQDVQALSGGEWQRVLLARALLIQPDILMLDEPVQGVDVQGQLALYQLIPQL